MVSATTFTQTILDKLWLSKLSDLWPSLFASVLTCQLLASTMTLLIFPQLQLPADTLVKRNINVQFGIQFVSMIHAIFASVAALWIFHDPLLATDRLFGYSELAGRICAATCGYFLWDMMISIRYRYLYGWGFVWHALFCFLVFLFGAFGPFALWYGGVFLMFEWSTPFVYMNWFMEKFGYGGSIYQLINGVILASIFFSVRLWWGLKMSVQFFVDLYHRPSVHDIPTWHKIIYSVANAVLMSLNIIWFAKICRAVGRRRRRKAACS